MEFSCSDDFCELLHVGRLDVDNVEALVLDVQVPEIDSQVIATDESLSIAVHRYAVDVIGVCVCVGLSRYGSDHGIVMGEAR